MQTPDFSFSTEFGNSAELWDCFFSAEFLLSFGCKRPKVEHGNSADLDMLFLFFIDSVSPMQFIAFHIDVFVIEKISYKEVVV